MPWTASLELVDKEATLWLNQTLTTPWTDPFWAFVTDKYTWFPVYAILLAYVIWRVGWKKALVLTAAVALAVVIADQGAGLVKHASERLRPCHDPWMLDHGVELPIGATKGLFGFFSAHAANAFAIIMTLLVGLRTVRPGKEKGLIWGGFVMAFLVSVSRIAVARHFLGDILVGAAFGTAVGLLLGLAARYAIRRFLPD